MGGRQRPADGAAGVPAEPVGDQPLAGLGLAEVRADVPSEVNKDAHTRPYTGIAAPWITSASGEQRKRMTLAVASGLGHWLWSALGIALRFASVSKMLGRTALTLMRYGLSSSARLLVRARPAGLGGRVAGRPRVA